jgi:hypothetical protein
LEIDLIEAGKEEADKRAFLQLVACGLDFSESMALPENSQKVTGMHSGHPDERVFFDDDHPGNDREEKENEKDENCEKPGVLYHADEIGPVTADLSQQEYDGGTGQ